MITSPFHPDYKHVGNEPENIEDMPYKTKTQCNYPRCSVSVEHGKRYCPKHLKDKPGNDKDVDKEYHKASYRRNRKRYVMDNPHCNHCGDLIQSIAHRHLDHIRPWKTGETEAEKQILFNDESNWQTLCSSCHSSKTRIENMDIEGKGVTIVFGPPFGGKTTYVLKEKEPNDIIVDMDLIYKAFTGNKMYHKPQELITLVMNLRDTAFNYIGKTRHKHKAWIITTETNTDRRKGLINRFDAESLLIDPGKEECLQRHMDSDRVERDWTKLINKWYDEFKEIEKDKRLDNIYG